ncbi:carboxypeptidase regulatory-like domain-containing protein [Terriglobus sp. TAA 43]|uniref:TonB-dependent receptor n=1 Tax=Terriglobus sp. TAA 43 TaxID=278961 RepID=UPI000646D6E0|nr:carboxypeptidase regulatory-like domain-containing protein [Terriglobus sp. TAA 43]
MKKQFVRLALAAVTLAGAPVLLSPSVFAQAVSVNGGAISGTITDPSGAVVSDASISVSNAETGFKRDLTTDKSGFYQIGPLNPGKYVLTVTASGFQTTTVQTVVRTGTATNGNFKLNIGQSSTEISVSTSDVQINTDQGGVSDVITKQQIDTLPINGRNFLDLAQIEPGVILQSGESFDPTKAGYSAISVGGVSGRTTRILLDGQDITDETVGTTIFNVSAGAINEFQLNRSTQDVSGELTSTGQVLVSTNSGTNQFHGQAFYQFQDHRALFAHAQNGFDAPFQRNQFGGSIGGPIIKDKLFFFANAERIKQDSSAVASLGTLFTSISATHPTIPTPYRETYSTVRLDYNGPWGAHFFVRANYNVNSVASNYGDGYWLYANRDNTPGIAAGADFTSGGGKFTHSFRGSYEKFHNLISDSSTNPSLYNGIPGLSFYYSTQHLYSGPNYLAPQGTFQSDKQLRYDGSWTKASHNIRYGYSLNRILGGGFASFFGLSPRVRIASSSLLANCNGVAGAAACPSDPLHGYSASGIVLGNGQGYFTEKGGFGLPGGGVFDWRNGAYVQDSWKVTPNFTLNAGVRWTLDTQRANQDLTLPTCADVDTSTFTGALNPCSGLAGSTPLPQLWNSNWTAKNTHQPYGNFAPQISMVYQLPDKKTVLRVGYGLFYEGDVMNNTTNARTTLIKQGAFNNTASICPYYGGSSVQFPDGTTVSSINGVSITNLCNQPLATAAPNIQALQAAYQANTKQNATSTNGTYLGETLTANGGSGTTGGPYGTAFRSPYSQQWNAGVQREIVKGGVLSADYIHNSTIKIAQWVDQNHIGAARYLNATAARNAIAATAANYTACAAAATTSAQADCAIANGATLDDFAGNGLDSGSQYLSGYAAAAAGKTPNTGAAFAGANALLGNGNFLVPIGRSGYDALQVVFRQVAQHPMPGIMSSNLQVSYNLSRIVSSYGGATNSDQFFAAGSWDYDNPNQYMGRNSLDRKHQVNFGGSMTLKYGPRIGLIGHFYSAAPTTLSLDSSDSTGGIFTTDLTGDGSIADLAPGTLPGDYMRRIGPKGLAGYVNNFNSTYAGTLTPAGKALVNAGILTQGQLKAMGATIQPLAAAASTVALPQPTTRSLDASFSYPIRLAKLREGISLEPEIDFYNLGNFANFSSTAMSGVLLNQTSAGAVNTTTGYLTGPNNYATLNANRIQRGSGTYNVGAARTTEFKLKLNF